MTTLLALTSSLNSAADLTKCTILESIQLLLHKSITSVVLILTWQRGLTGRHFFNTHKSTHSNYQTYYITMEQLRPLPDDIQAMHEQETACQYCGISYLLLSKYETMCRTVEKLEFELNGLKVD